MAAAGLAPYDPQEACSSCGTEGAALADHPNGGQPGAACEREVRLGPHLCRRCGTCGRRWMNALPESARGEP
jgi:hypothetical protein